MKRLYLNLLLMIYIVIIIVPATVVGSIGGLVKLFSGWDLTATKWVIWIVKPIEYIEDQIDKEKRKNKASQKSKK